MAKIKHAEIYHAKKKERENFPIYGIFFKLKYRVFTRSIQLLKIHMQGIGEVEMDKMNWWRHTQYGTVIKWICIMDRGQAIK